MAKIDTTVTIKFAWWGRPYLWVAGMFFRSVAPFLDLDDPRWDAFWNDQLNFLLRHRGLRIYLG